MSDQHSVSSSPPPPSVVERFAEISPRSRAVVTLAVTFAMFMATLDQTIVGTALPSIVEDLGDPAKYTWVVTAYLVPATIFVPLFGRFSDLVGRKWLLMAGTTVFLLGSALCASAGSMNELAVYRGVQGLGAAALTTIPLALLLELYPPSAAARVQSLFGGLIALSLLVGPALGGVITQHTAWQWVFLVNIPVGVLVMLALGLLPNYRPQNIGPIRFDVVGILLFAGAVSGVLIGLSRKGALGASGHLPEWSDASVIVPIVVGLVLLSVFAVVEYRSEDPILPVRLLAVRGFAVSCGAAFIVSIAMYPAVVFLPRLFQQARGASPTTSGVHIYPLMIGLVLGIVVLGVVIGRTGTYRVPLLLSPVLIGLGGLLFAGLDENTSTEYLNLAMFVLGLGIGPCISGLMLVAQNSLDASDTGLATSTVTFFRQIGGSVALAVAGSMFTASLVDRLESDQAAGHAPDMADAVANSVSLVLSTTGIVAAVLALGLLLMLPRITIRRE